MDLQKGDIFFHFYYDFSAERLLTQPYLIEIYFNLALSNSARERTPFSICSKVE
jgi:hypothetical protein